MSKQEKLGQEEAFACASSGGHQPGMSKRFYAACAAMQGLLSGGLEMQILLAKTAEEHGVKPDAWMVRCAYNIADELLKQENE